MVKIIVEKEPVMLLEFIHNSPPVFGGLRLCKIKPQTGFLTLHADAYDKVKVTFLTASSCLSLTTIPFNEDYGVNLL